MPLGAIYLACSALRGGSGAANRGDLAREALLELVKNTYMNLFLTREQRAAEFELLSRLVNHVPCRRLTPHRECNENWKALRIDRKDARTMAGNRQQRLAVQQE